MWIQDCNGRLVNLARAEVIRIKKRAQYWWLIAEFATGEIEMARLESEKDALQERDLLRVALLSGHENAILAGFTGVYQPSVPGPRLSVHDSSSPE